jgi:hypothetical protein
VRGIDIWGQSKNIPRSKQTSLVFTLTPMI